MDDHRSRLGPALQRLSPRPLSVRLGERTVDGKTPARPGSARSGVDPGRGSGRPVGTKRVTSAEGKGDRRVDKTQAMDNALQANGGPGTGLAIRRFFTRAGEDPLDGVA